MRLSLSTPRPRTFVLRSRQGSRQVGAVILAIGLVVIGAGFVTSAAAQAAALGKDQAAVAAYEKALREFKAALIERRGQIEAKQKLPEKPGQALYLARLQ